MTCKQCGLEKRKWPRLGRVVMSRSVDRVMSAEGGRASKFKNEVRRALRLYKRGNWGKSDSNDKKVNDNAVKTGQRIIAVYPTVEGDIWIITERGHYATTILFPNEY